MSTPPPTGLTDTARAPFFFGRLIPTVRTLISVPAGIARMNLLSFLAWSTLRTIIWTAFLTFAGYILESQYDRVAAWLDPVTKVVIGLIVLGYIYRVLTFGRRAERQLSSRTWNPQQSDSDDGK